MARAPISLLLLYYRCAFIGLQTKTPRKALRGGGSALSHRPVGGPFCRWLHGTPRTTRKGARCHAQVTSPLGLGLVPGGLRPAVAGTCSPAWARAGPPRARAFAVTPRFGLTKPAISGRSQGPRLGARLSFLSPWRSFLLGGEVWCSRGAERPGRSLANAEVVSRGEGRRRSKKGRRNGGEGRTEGRGKAGEGRRGPSGGRRKTVPQSFRTTAPFGLELRSTPLLPRFSQATSVRGPFSACSRGAFGARGAVWGVSHRTRGEGPKQEPTLGGKSQNRRQGRKQ